MKPLIMMVLMLSLLPIRSFGGPDWMPDLLNLSAKELGITTDEFLRAQRINAGLPCIKEYSGLYIESGYFMLRKQDPTWHLALRTEENNAKALVKSLNLYFTLLYSALGENKALANRLTTEKRAVMLYLLTNASAAEKCEKLLSTERSTAESIREQIEINFQNGKLKVSPKEFDWTLGYFRTFVNGTPNISSGSRESFNNNYIGQ